jgi:hypothetical protein
MVDVGLQHSESTAIGLIHSSDRNPSHGLARDELKIMVIN